MSNSRLKQGLKHSVLELKTGNLKPKCYACVVSTCSNKNDKRAFVMEIIYRHTENVGSLCQCPRLPSTLHIAFFPERDVATDRNRFDIRLSIDGKNSPRPFPSLAQTKGLQIWK